VKVGIGYLSAFLKSDGHGVELIHLIRLVKR